MWAAQVTLWVQDDILGALAKVNENAAKQLPEKDRWVGNLPVKHLQGIWLGGYVPPAEAAGAPVFGHSSAQAGAAPTGPPPGYPAAVFTNRGTMDGVDVIQFALQLVVDAHALPAIIDEICAAGFYTPLNVSYQVISPNPSLEGYIYGSSGLIRVRLEFEGCFLRKKYEKWMPETVVTAIREKQAADFFQATAGTSQAPTEQPGGTKAMPGLH